MSGYPFTLKSKQQPLPAMTYDELRRLLQRKKTREARLLIEAGVPVNSPHGRDCNTILHLAIMCGDIELVQLVLSKGALVSAKNTNAKTPLHLAAEFGCEKIVQLLISKGALVNTTAKDGSTPIQASITSLRSEIFHLLVSNGAKTDVTLNTGETLFYAAVKSGVPAIVDCFLRHGLVNKKANKSCLKLAILSRNEKIEQLLLAYNFEVDPQCINDSNFFHAIIAKGHAKLVSDLLIMSAQVNSSALRENSTGFTLLHTACRYQQFKIIELLILHGVDLNVKDNRGKMPIYYAVTSLNVEIVRLLLINEAYVKDDPDLLNIAANKQQTEIVLLLLDHGADITGRDELARTVLHSAVVDQSPQSLEDVPLFTFGLSLVLVLLKRGARVDARVATGETALHMAVQNDNEVIVKTLLEYDANVNVSNSKGTTPLHLAAQVKNLTIVNRLLSRNADVRASDLLGVTALHFAAEAGQVDIIESLLKYKPDVNAVDQFNSTSLHYAAKYGPVECVSILLDHNADVNAFDISGSTPLHLAVGSEHAGIVELLIKFNAKIDMPNEFGDTCLHISVDRDVGITKLLLNHCKDINCVNKDGLTPLLIAARKSPPLVACLIESGADIHLTDSKGRNALHIAAKNRQLESVVSLLGKNADVNCKDVNGLTPLLIGILNGNSELVNTLLQFNADVNYTGYKNKSVLHFALNGKSKDIIHNLLIHGADVNFVNDDGLTALLIAKDFYYSIAIEAMNLLLKFGADTEFKTRDGKTALYIATVDKQASQVGALLNYGADMSVSCENKIALFKMFKFSSSDYADYSECEDCGGYGCDCNYRSYRKNRWHRNLYDDNSRYEEFSSHVDDCSHVVDIYRRHIRKLEAAGFYVDKDVIRALKYFKRIEGRAEEEDNYGGNYDISSDIEDESDYDTDDESDFGDNDGDSKESRELEAMKSENIGTSNITFYNFLTSSIHRVARYVKNKDIVDIIKLGDYELIFPIYTGMIKGRLYCGLERGKLLEKCDFFHHFAVLPYDCIDQILSFLSNQDLRMLIDSYKSLTVAGKRRYIFIS